MTILSYTFLLLRSRWLIVWNNFKRSKPGRKIGLLVLIVALGLAAYGLYNLTSVIVAAFNSAQVADLVEQAQRGAANPRRPGAPPPPQLDVEGLRHLNLDVLPNILFITLLFTLTFSSFATTLSSLFLSSDLEFLLAAPVPMRSVFLSKFITTLFSNSAFLLLLGLPALVGYGTGLNFHPLYFVLLPFVPILVAMIPVGLGSLLVMLLVRYIPARRVREVLTVVGALVGASFYLVTQLANVRNSPVAGTLVSGSSRLLRYIDTPYLPSTWAGQALVAAGRADWGSLAVNLGLLAVLAFGIFAASLLIAEELYYNGWSNINAIPSGRKTRRAGTGPVSAPAPLRGVVAIVPRPLQAIIVKDWKTAIRDPQNLTQIFMPLAMLVVFSIQGQQLGRNIPGQFAGIAVMTTGLLALFTSSIIFTRFALASIGRESKSFWLVRIAPISLQQLLWGKFLAVYLPFGVLGTVVAVVLNLLTVRNGEVLLLSILFVLLGAAGITGINLSFGAAFPRLNWDNPSRQTSFRAGCLSPIVYLLFMGLLFILFTIPILSVQFPEVESYTLEIWVASLLVAAGMTVGSVYLGLQVAAQRLAQLDAVE